MGALQMAAQRLERHAADQADEMVALHRLPHRHGGLGPGRRLGRMAETVQLQGDRGDQPADVSGRDRVVAEIGDDDLGRQAGYGRCVVVGAHAHGPKSPALLSGHAATPVRPQVPFLSRQREKARPLGWTLAPARRLTAPARPSTVSSTSSTLSTMGRNGSAAAAGAVSGSGWSSRDLRGSLACVHRSLRSGCLSSRISL